MFAMLRQEAHFSVLIDSSVDTSPDSDV